MMMATATTTATGEENVMWMAAYKSFDNDRHPRPHCGNGDDDGDSNDDCDDNDDGDGRG